MTENNDKPILVIAELENGRISHTTYELLRAGRDLAQTAHCRLSAAIVGNDAGAAAELSRFVDDVYLADHPLLGDFQTDLLCLALEQVVETANPHTVIMTYSTENMDIAPKLAYKTGAQFLADCVGLNTDETHRHLLCEKPVYGDKVMAVFDLEGPLCIVAMRPRALAALEETNEKKGAIIPVSVTLNETLATTRFIKALPEEGVSLDKAAAIVAGGRGIKEAAGVTRLEDLAQALRRFYEGVDIGASRPLVDNGLLPPSRQVGLTGEKVSPKLYVAVAISGASQHISGMSASKKVIAINRDNQALIFESSDYGAVGDYEKIIPPFIRKLEKLP